jgi:hypothetical protein
MPYADLSDLERGWRVGKITDRFTVDLLVRYVTWKLEGGVADHAGLSTARTDSGPLTER